MNTPGLTLEECAKRGWHLESVDDDGYCNACGHQELHESQCIEYGEECRGTVEYRMPLSGSGKPFPRCDGHWEKRLDRQEEINRRYPDSPMPPSDFDPTFAGERWDDEY